MSPPSRTNGGKGVPGGKKRHASAQQTENIPGDPNVCKALAAQHWSGTKGHSSSISEDTTWKC
eukprot:3559672-Amphidinium_carterae.1